MAEYVTEILAPFFETKRAAIGRPNQRCLWIIDCWSVHRSEQFLTWMRTTYPWISVIFVPAGCTGLAQPCDVGIQRVLKHTIRRSMLNDMVQETIDLLEGGNPPDSILLNTKIGKLRDRSVGWMVNGWDRISNAELIQEVFILFFGYIDHILMLYLYRLSRSPALKHSTFPTHH